MLRSVASSVAGLAVAGALVTSPVLAAGGYPIYGNVEDELFYAPPITWSGIYLGLHAGYGWAESDWRAREDIDSIVDAGDRFSHDLEGGIVGGQIGFNYQTGGFVWGLEATLAAADISESTRPFIGLFDNIELTTEIEKLWSVTGRLGYDWGPLLTYVKGGYAGADVKLTASELPVFEISESKVHHGWVVGGGIEYLASADLVLGLEYNYYDLGEEAYRRVVENDVTLQTVTARVSYKFGLRDRELPFVPLK